MSRSLDLRQQALRAFARGMSQREVLEVFGISRATLHRWRLREQQGTLPPRCSPGGPRKLSSEQEQLLWQQLQQSPDATVDEHLRRWHASQDHSISRATMGRAILRLKWTYKKSP
jgi:transposase